MKNTIIKWLGGYTKKEVTKLKLKIDELEIDIKDNTLSDEFLTKDERENKRFKYNQNVWLLYIDFDSKKANIYKGVVKEENFSVFRGFCLYTVDIMYKVFVKKLDREIEVCNKYLYNTKQELMLDLQKFGYSKGKLPNINFYIRDTFSEDD